MSNGSDRVVDRSGEGKRRYRRNDALAAGERGQDTQFTTPDFSGQSSGRSTTDSSLAEH